MARARKLCSHPTCSSLQPCPRHTRRPFGGSAGRPSFRQRGYDAKYERNRRIVLAEETHCGICHKPGRADDQADHITAISDGGSNERSNLRRAHRDCNLARGQR